MVYFPLKPEDRIVVERWLSAGGSPNPEDVSQVVGYPLWPQDLAAIGEYVASNLDDGGAWGRSLDGVPRTDLGRFFSQLLDAVAARECRSLRGRVRAVARLCLEGVEGSDPRWRRAQQDVLDADGAFEAAFCAWAVTMTYLGSSVHPREYYCSRTCWYANACGVRYAEQARYLSGAP